jgi:hypothetical protein
MRITDETTRTVTLVLEGAEIYNLKRIARAYLESYADDDIETELLATAIVNHDYDD